MMVMGRIHQGISRFRAISSHHISRLRIAVGPSISLLYIRHRSPGDARTSSEGITNPSSKLSMLRGRSLYESLVVRDMQRDREHQQDTKLCHLFRAFRQISYMTVAWAVEAATLETISARQPQHGERIPRHHHHYYVEYLLVPRSRCVQSEHSDITAAIIIMSSPPRGHF